MDLEKARSNMIEQQIRPWDVSGPEVLELLRQVPREEFVSEAQRSLAFADLSLPIGHGEIMWQPKIEARVLQALAPQADECVLEIGTGSGYLTALLASSSSKVTSIDLYSDFLEQAEIRLGAQHIDNVSLKQGDGAQGWSTAANWDLIILTGSVSVLPDSFRESLAPGGRLIAIIGQEPIMEAMLYTHQWDGHWVEQSLFDTSLPPLLNSVQPDGFVF
jgi:protein-L-isoaspartate(D-aspartate) O-methyltransferase